MKRDARVVAVGNMVAAIIAKYAKSIPIENITGPVMFNLKMAAAQVSFTLSKYNFPCWWTQVPPGPCSEGPPGPHPQKKNI